jgi:5,10-methylenetetrahydromethanopterin reductase
VALRFSFQMLPEQSIDELIDAVVLADELGYHACYSADEIYHKDMWLLFAAAARQTERIRLGPCVSPIYLRDPLYLAQLAATLDELSGGRAEVVFGIGNLAMLDQYGVTWKGSRPIARLREAHTVMRTFLDHAEIDFAGDFYRYSGIFTAARPVQERLPLKIGAMGGPKSMQLAGEVADGMLTACAYSSEAITYALDQVRLGAARAGRDGDALDIGDNLLGAISPDPEAARTAARVLAAFYIPSMPASLLERHGLNRDELAPVIDAFAAGQVERALELTPDSVVDALSVAGTPRDWVERLRRDVLPTGLEHLLLSFADPFTVKSWSGREIDGLPDLAGQLRLFKDEVIPALT